MAKTSLLTRLTSLGIHSMKPSSEDNAESEKVESSEHKFILDTGNEGEMDTWVSGNYEGQLSVDVYQTKDDIVIKSVVAGVDPENLDISISSDMVTIRGVRHQDEAVLPQDYFYQECYFGPFSRSVILPQDVDAKNATAEFKKGILVIRLPKSRERHKIEIRVQDDE